MGALGALVTFLSVINVAFDLDLSFGTRGATSPLPKHWDEVAGIGIASVLFAALGGVLSSEAVARIYRERRLVKYGTVLLLPVLATVGFFQLRYLNHGGKLQWAAAEGRIDVLEPMLAAERPEPETLAEAWFKAVHYRQVESARVLAKAGVELDGRCEPLRTAVMRKAELAQIVMDAGADPKKCSEDLIYLALIGGAEDREEAVRLLVDRGVSPGQEALAALERSADSQLSELVRARAHPQP